MARPKKTQGISQEEVMLRATLELERRRIADPPAFYQPASDKIEQFHRSPAMVRALFGANRSSKTESALMDVVFHLRGEHPYQVVPKPPVYWRVVVPDFNQVEKVINDKLRRMCPPSMLIDGSFEKSYNTRTHIITFRNGSKLDIMTHLQPIAAFEGSSRHGTLFDEEAPEDIYTSCVMRHVDVCGKTIMAMTPLNGLTYTYDEIYLKSFLNPNIASWTLSIYENRFLNQAAIDEIEKLITDEIDREIRLYGKFRSKTGLVFNFDPEVHIYDMDEKLYEYWDGEYPPHYWMQFVGIDPGWGHPCGLIWLAVDPDTSDHYFFRNYRESYGYPDEHAQIIRAYNREMGIRNPIYVIDSQAKANTYGSQLTVLEQYQQESIFPVLGTKHLLEGNMHLGQLMRIVTGARGDKHSKFHVSRECIEFIQEIGKYQRAKPTDMNSKERFIDKENDVIAAARYAAWEANKWDYETYAAVQHISRPKPEQRKGFSRTGY